MTRTTSPTVSRRWLALAMRRLRKERRLSQGVVAKALGCQVPKISLLENGQRPLHDADLKTLLELFDVPDEARHQYFDELKNAQEHGWWEFHDAETVPEWYSHFIGLEQGADRIRAYQPAVVHGLLQTREYSAALRHLVGSKEIVRDQLEHVAAVCETNERVTVQVIPFDHGRAVAAAHGPFTVLTFGGGADSGIVYRERHSGAYFFDSLCEIDEHSFMFQRLPGFALAPRESLQFLMKSADAWSCP